MCSLVEQVVNGKIRDEKEKKKIPSAESKNNPIEVAETSSSANH